MHQRFLFTAFILQQLSIVTISRCQLCTIIQKMFLNIMLDSQQSINNPIMIIKAQTQCKLYNRSINCLVNYIEDFVGVQTLVQKPGIHYITFPQICRLEMSPLVAKRQRQSPESWQLADCYKAIVRRMMGFRLWFIQPEDIRHVWYFETMLYCFHKCCV